jgi:transcriptional activator of cad operon
LKIGHWTLKCDESLICRGEIQVQLEPKLVDVLSYLAINQGKVISRDELIEHVWQGAVVTDNAVNRVIAKLRKSLNHGDTDSQYIVTIPKKGYLLKAVVESVEPGVIHTEQVLAIDSSRGDDTVAGLQTHESKWKKQGFATLYLIIISIFFIVLTIIYKLYSTPEAKVEYNSVKPFTTLAGNEDEANFSPAGDMIAFTHQAVNSHSTNTYIQNVQTRQRLRLTNNDAIESLPAWSPDSTKLLLHRRSNESCHYVVIHLDKLTKELLREQVVLDCDSSLVIGGAVWGKDSHTFYYPKATSLSQPLRIYSYNVQTGEQKQITTPPKGVTGDYHVKLSATGNELLILRNLYWFDTEVRVVDLNTLESQLLFSKPWPLQSISWGESNRFLVYADMEGKIIQYDRELNTDSTIWLSSNTVSSPVISPINGNLVFTSGSSRNSDIWALSLAAKERDSNSEAWKSTAVINSTVSDVHPSFAKTSNRFAYFSLKSGLPQIWIRELNGVDKQVSRFETMFETSNISWSHDDRYLLATSRNRVYSIDVANGDLVYHTPITLNAKHPVWSKNGRNIYFTSDIKGSWQIWQVVAFQPQKLEQVTESGGFSSQLASNGQALYYTKQDRNGLYKWDFSSKTESLIHATFPVNAYFNWKSIGDDIYYATTGENAGIYRLRAGIANSEKLSEIKGLRLRGLSVSQDGKKILWVHNAPTATDLKIVVRNFSD